MNVRSSCLALAVAAAVLAPPAAFAQVSGADHADRMAAEIALKRAQIRARLACTPGRVATPQELPAHPPRTGNYPTTGTGGPVPAPGLTTAGCGR